MFKSFYKTTLKWSLLNISLFSMVMVPVAEGFAAQNRAHEINKSQVTEALIKMGLNKTQTYGEFYSKNKDIFPARLQKDLASYFESHKTELMPQFDLGSVKNSEGKVVPTLRVSQKGQLINIQLSGETDKYLRFNNTQLTEIDLINFKDALEKISAGDQKLRDQLLDQNKNKNFGKKILDFDEKTWVKLTPQQRAGYIISLRLLYNDAHGVLLSLNKKTTPQKNKKFSILQNILGSEAMAVTEASEESIWDEAPTAAPTPVSVSQSVSSATNGNVKNNGLDSCLVAGYVTTYKGKVCTYAQLKSEYTNESSLARKAFEYCGNKIACNPLVFGTPGGKPRCIDRKDNAKVQIATHFSGPCENENHTNSEIKFIKDEKDNAGRYAVDNLTKNSKQIKEAAQKEQMPNYAATEEYIKGLLLYSKNSPLLNLFTSKKVDATLLKELLRIKDDFNSEIEQATNACKQASQNQRKHEKNFWGACDQLQRRFLFVAEYLDSQIKCADKSKVNPETLMCSCVGGEAETVLPGAECKKIPVVEPPVPPVKPEQPDSTEVGQCNPACSALQTCEKQIEYDGIEHWQCVTKGQPKPTIDPMKKKGGFGQFLNKALPWITTAAVLTGMYFLWKPKKPGIALAGDLCPDGSGTPCKSACVSPLVLVSSGVCACGNLCPPGQTITNLKTCACETPTRDVKLICADGFSIVDDISQCPKPKITCWDGSQVEDAVNCPSQPSDLEKFPTVNSKTNK